ncbi:hypothetical protein OQY15_12605, partial [Pedobacter sp. MC2016-15]|uniref:hypothetical protein n=1 Tax=Pedobacter sp. MC2016-15 TaxID=2994473 RepID=UPI0022459E4A
MKLPLLSVLLRSGRLISLIQGYKRGGFLVKKGFSLVAFFILFFIPFFAFAQFPYKEDFKGASPKLSDVVFGGAPSAYLTAGTAPPGVTDAPNDKPGEGYLRLTNNFGNQKGYVFSNNVFTGNYGLNIEFEYFTYGGNGADGICFFLFDAAVTENDFNIGGFGGSLGYSQLNGGPGVSKGYLGIGLDEYGNFSNPTENRQGGDGFIENSVTLRGAGDGFQTDGKNYAFLKSYQTSKGSRSFKIAGGVRGAEENKTGYRKVIINLIPRKGGGLLINVSIRYNDQITKVITDYPYDVPIPAAGLKYGISSSTGGSNNYHEIRGLTLGVNRDQLKQPTAGNDIIETCQNNPISYLILKNDDTPNANGPIKLDQVDLNPQTPEIEQSITKAGIGTYTFSQETQELTFTPEPTFLGTDAIEYTYRDFYDEKSTIGTVTVKVLTPRITSQPQSVTICQGADFSASAVVDEDATGFQWMYLVPGGKWEAVKDGNGISGSTTKTLMAKDVSDIANGYKYRLDVFSANCTVSSSIATLTVNPKPVAEINGSVQVCANSGSSIITLKGSKGTAPYTFTYQKVGSAEETIISDNNGVATISQPNGIVGAYEYKLVSVKDASSTGCSYDVTGNAIVQVNPLPTASIGGGKDVCVST